MTFLAIPLILIPVFALCCAASGVLAKMSPPEVGAGGGDIAAAVGARRVRIVARGRTAAVCCCRRASHRHCSVPQTARWRWKRLKKGVSVGWGKVNNEAVGHFPRYVCTWRRQYSYQDGISWPGSGNFFLWWHPTPPASPPKRRRMTSGTRRTR